MFFWDSEYVGPDEDDGSFQWTYDSHDKETETEQSPHSSGQKPEKTELISEIRTDPVGCEKEEGEDAVQNIHEVKEPKHDVEPVEEKPWRKSGADITDYFNYGFDEDSWKAYRMKHAKLQAFQAQHIANLMREQAKYEMEMMCASSNSGRPSRKSCRRRKAKTTRRGGKGRSRRSREKARPCRTDAAKDTQSVMRISHKKDTVTNYDMPRSVNVRTVFSFVPPPSSLFQFYQSESPTNTLSSDNVGNIQEPSTSLYPCFPGNMSSDFAVVDSAKAWECYIKQQRSRDRDRDRDREYCHDKNRRRCSDRDKQRSSLSRHSEKKLAERRDSVDYEYKRSRIEGVAGKKKQKEEEDASRKTSQRSSNASRKDDREARKTRHNHAKGKDAEKARRVTEKRK
ncbi:pre-mRNA 3'-end-processing factor FIP1 isoform X2 [Poeciliopsis prolifica]|uniref:pre-mRNA 3'-end-processing factor FIP1 isoform X2 n=1 Tax=Poeciliopsis prolifica TaxID=188132 RepID=UPI0024130CCE|nr:pre-mRNA 3'-end-processing factor FIP1 isoform X2 [Poeciliopsis prolifica]